jgi:DNA primase
MGVSDEIKQRIDLVDFIARYTPLKKAGSTYKGLCPFHSERTPSFVVFPHTGTWHCFGACGVGGDLFAFVMRKENLDFREALQLLAREAGVELDQGDSAQSANRRTQIYEANEAATAYFQDVLRSHPAAEVARRYLARRGIDDDTAARFQLGYALDAWSGLRDHLTARNVGIDLQLEAGLLKRNEERASTYDAFRARLMIPIRDRMGRVIGFGGRVLDDSQPKYLNTAETPVFHKSHVIYGLDMAHEAIRDAGKVVIVEGYMDVIAAHQFGFTNVVACMGTALTPDQLQQLQRYTSSFVLALDADSAGEQATIRGLNQARQALTRVRKPTVTPGGVRIEERLAAALFIASMPEGRDPDDVVRQEQALWRTLIDQAKPLVDFYFSVIAHQVDLTTARGKGSAVAELAPLIAELEDEIEREHYVQQLSRLVQLDERTILGRVQAAARAGRVAPQNRGEAPRRRQSPPPMSPMSPNDGVFWPPEFDPALLQTEPPPAAARPPARAREHLQQEDFLLAHLLREPDLLIWLAAAATEREILPPNAEDWQHVENQEIFRALRNWISSDEQWDIELFQETLPGALHGRLGHLMAAWAAMPTTTGAELRTDLLKVLVRLRLDSLRTRSVQVKFLIDETAQEVERTDARDLFAVNNQLLRDLGHLQATFHDLSRVLVSQRRAEKGVKVR